MHLLDIKEQSEEGEEPKKNNRLNIMQTKHKWFKQKMYLKRKKKK